MARVPVVMVDGVHCFAKSEGNPFSSVFHALAESELFSQRTPAFLWKKVPSTEKERLSELLLQYDTAASSEKKLTDLLEIELLGKRLKLFDKLEAVCALEFDAFRKSSLNDTYDYWHYLLACPAYESIDEIDAIIAENKIDYAPYVMAIRNAADACKKIKVNGNFKKSIGVVLDKLNNDLISCSSDKDETRNALYRKHHWDCADSILHTCHAALLEIALYDECLLINKVMLAAARLASYTEALRKVPNSPAGRRSRERIFARKDSADSIGDATSIVAMLNESQSLRDRLGIHNDIYALKRIVASKKEKTNRAEWLDELVSGCLGLITKYCDKGKIENPFNKAMARYLFKLRDLICQMPVNEAEQSALQKFELPIKSEGRVCMADRRASDGYMHRIESELIDLLREMDAPDSELMKPFDIQGSSLKATLRLLGGVDPIVYQVGVRSNLMVFRAYRTALAEGNVEALGIMKEVIPNILGEVYYQSGSVDDLGYEACEFSEYFAGGSFSDYLERLHNRSAACFAENDKKRLFDVFKTLMLMLDGMHKRGCYFPDIKPDNLLFDKNPAVHPDAQLKISDTKSANTLPEDGKTYEVMYTLDFAAPEVLVMMRGGDKIDPRAHDYYALAITMLRAITGKTDQSEIRAYVGRDQFEERMLELLKGMLAEDPAKRLEFIRSHLVAENLDQLEEELVVAAPASDAASPASVFGERGRKAAAELAGGPNVTALVARFNAMGMPAAAPRAGV